MKLIRHICTSNHGSDVSGPKWNASPCSENAAHPQAAPFDVWMPLVCEPFPEHQDPT